MLPVRRGHRGGGDVDNAGTCTEAEGNHCKLHCNTPNIRVFYWGGADDGFHSEPEVVGKVPHPVGRKRSRQRGG